MGTMGMTNLESEGRPEVLAMQLLLSRRLIPAVDIIQPWTNHGKMYRLVLCLCAEARKISSLTLRGVKTRIGGLVRLGIDNDVEFLEFALSSRKLHPCELFDPSVRFHKFPIR